MINDKILKVLACPVCKGDLLWMRGENVLICTACNDKKYYIGPSDVPILVTDEAEYEKRYGWKYQHK